MLRKRVYEILEVSEGDRLSRGFDIFIISLIVLNIVALVLETVEPVYKASPSFFKTFEWISMIIFSAEYILRIWCSVESPDHEGAVKTRFQYMISFYGLIDLMAILPFYLPFIGGDFRFLRAVRLFRLFRVLKLARYTFALSGLKKVLQRKKEELVCVGFLLTLLLVIASSSMFFLEHEVQPETFSSIPATMWWGIVTLTTVGYGDVYPITFMGKILGAVIAILGIGLFALPAGLIGSAYLEELEERKNTKKLMQKVSDDLQEGDARSVSKHLMLDIWLKETPVEAHVHVVCVFFYRNFSGFHDVDSYSPSRGFQSLVSSDHTVMVIAKNKKENLFYVDWVTKDSNFDFESYKESLLSELPVEHVSETLLLRGVRNLKKESSEK